jgi:beta-lactamase superfamily II metal-dependent hydrolase
MATKNKKAAKTTRNSAAVKKSTWTRRGSEVGIRVRMYRVGFGDFFLVSFLGDQGDPVHVIVDCGVFKGTSQTGDLGSIELAVADMAKTTQGKVALIVVTHRHADHIAGFGRCAPTFQSLTVQAIWMSIWESQYSTALQFQAELTKAATALQTHFTALGVSATQDQQTARKFMENANGETGKGSNAKALNLLKQGIPGVSPSYYQAGQSPTLPPACVQAGVGARILGPPPIADVQLMKLMDLQKGIGQYITGLSANDDTRNAPFGSDWTVGARESYDASSFFEWFDNRWSSDAPSADQVENARQNMESALKCAQPDAAMAAAAQLNSFLNNQSLVILFTFKGKNLLFVGDAQAGNWEHWIFGTDDPKKAAGGTMTADAQSILTSLDFYKVGHHGSGNATPKTVVDAMGKGKQKFAAMCSTENGVYGKENIQNPSAGTEVPRVPLMSALGAVSSLVRSDQLRITVNDEDKKAMDDAPIPTGGGGRFEAGALWIDCYL